MTKKNDVKIELVSQIELTPRTKNAKIQDAATVVSREKAMKSGFILYWNGEKCSRGHKSVRYTKDGVCKQCYKEFRAGLIASKQVDRDKSVKISRKKKSTTKTVDLTKVFQNGNILG